MSELKPCPFCGKESAFVVYNFYEERPYYQHYARVMCAVCQAEVGDIGFSDTREEAEEKVIKAWNRRAYERKAD